jgi:hypothetical protein
VHRLRFFPHPALRGTWAPEACVHSPAFGVTPCGSCHAILLVRFGVRVAVPGPCPTPPVGAAVFVLLFNRRRKLFGDPKDPFIATAQVCVSHLRALPKWLWAVKAPLFGMSVCA